MDDDVDGLTDSADPECTSPRDNDEGTFATNIPGDNIDPCSAECWFDGNSGAGDDMCQTDRNCDPQAPQSGLWGTCGVCGAGLPDTPPECVTACRPIQPNGCDCFGCCSVFDATTGARHDVILLSTCDYETELDDPMQCPSCTKVVACDNPCDPCEYCIGRDPIGACTVDAGACATPCNPHTANTCAPGFWCLTGCCVRIM